MLYFAMDRKGEKRVSDEEWLTVKQVAAKLSVSAFTVRHWLRTGQLAGILMGDRAGYRVAASELSRFLVTRQKRRDEP